MFYSHQLLARKAPLGQICEEILNPSVPMALRLSGILMGGVVIVYERKVKLLYEDVTHLLVEINEAWKVKAKRDPTILPKGKSHAKYEAVTLPDNQPADLGDFEQHLQFSNSDTLMGMHKSAYIDMAILAVNWFDIEGDGIELDGDTQEKFPSHNHTVLPNTLVPSPPLQDEPQNRKHRSYLNFPAVLATKAIGVLAANELHEQPPGDHINHQSEEDEVQHIPQMKRPSRKRARRAPSVIMDYEQTMIPGHMYQSWLQYASDIVSRRGRKRKHLGSIRSIKIERLMDLPPVALVDGLFTNGNRDICYPLPLLKQWTKLTQPVHDSPPGETSPPHPPAPSSSSPPETNNYHDATTFPFEDHHSGVGSGSLGVSVEKGRLDVNNHEMPHPPVAEAGMAVTPANSGGRVKSMNSESGSGFVLHDLDINSGSPNFKLAQLSESELSPENLTVESISTQTQKVPVADQPMEQLTDSIRMQLKTHFDTPGSAQTESLNQLALGLDRKKAACLFYHTCGMLLDNP
ncbi:hypothetical protein L1987_11628 [Smallanthus sonchifolius]|uniref:Uncharacterized protein n=1 Tax=Smallanthus sonchifolius TaxID=185202 RepID=A0ACB9JC20_9ASTR|nr:hypothetical protein L1987_11628 [Smallanthus sonchifolius]